VFPTVLTAPLILTYGYVSRRGPREVSGRLLTVSVNGERFKVLAKDPELASVFRSMLRGEGRGSDR